jgi:hypothetical protein
MRRKSQQFCVQGRFDQMMVAQAIVVSDERLDLGFEIAWAGNKEYRYGYTQGK